MSEGFLLTEAALADMVDRFYARVRADALLGPVFEAAVHDWPEHLAKLTDFWCSVALGARRYHGRPMQAHFPLPITPDMFPRWLALFATTTAELFPPVVAEHLDTKARNIARSFELAMTFKPEAAGG